MLVEEYRNMVVLTGDTGGLYLCSDQPIRTEHKLIFAHRIVKINKLFDRKYIMEHIPFISKAAYVEECGDGKHRIRAYLFDEKNKTYRYRSIGDIPLTSLIDFDNELLSD